MGIDPSNHYLATGDMDGLVKIWNIANYCTGRQGYTTEPPRKLYAILTEYVFLGCIELDK